MSRIENISLVIHLLDKHLLKILTKDDVDDDKLSVLTDIRSTYIGELNNIIRNQNTSDMFNKKYWDLYRRKHH